jgi:hypothetical protein
MVRSFSVFNDQHNDHRVSRFQIPYTKVLLHAIISPCYRHL